jgi:hypothetical protein
MILTGHFLFKKYNGSLDKLLSKPKSAAVEVIVESKQAGDKLAGSAKTASNQLEYKAKSIKEKLGLLLGEDRGKKISREFADVGLSLNNELCKEYFNAMEEVQAKSEKSFWAEHKRVKVASHQFLKDYHHMADELSRYNFKNNQHMVRASGYDPRFIFDLEEVQKPCRDNPELITDFMANLSRYYKERGESSNWMVYRTAEFNMRVVKKLDSFQAFKLGLTMLENLARDGHFKRRDVRAIKNLRRNVHLMDLEFQNEILEVSQDATKMKETMAYWDDRKMVTKLKIKRYMSDLSKRYPTHEEGYGTSRLPDLI